MILRDYQIAARDACFTWFQTRDDDPALVLATGSGKSLLLSAIIAKARENYPALRACVLATQAELVQQNARAAAQLIPASDIGIFSAGLKRKEADRAVTIGNIQSLARKPYDVGPFDLLIIDEAHTIADADSGQYRTFIAAQRVANPKVRLVGLTATPYKLSSGLITEGEGALFGGIAYETDLVSLIEQGYLCRPVTRATTTQVDVSGVHTRAGEYVQSELAAAVDIDATTAAAVDEMCAKLADRHHWVIFCVSVDHARHVAEALSARGIPTGVVHGDLARDERAYRLDAFARGELRAICNCQLLTTGWDCPQVDALVLLRPTKSAGLYAQMVGRCLRVHPSKTNAIILDMALLIQQFGPIDAIDVPSRRKKGEAPAPVKTCPGCNALVAAGYRVCPDCGHEFPEPERPPIIPVASTLPILSTEPVEPEWEDVTKVEYHYHDKREGTPSLRVEYYNGYRRIASEWVCLEHQGFALQKAQSWWHSRSPESAIPATIAEALDQSADLLCPIAVATQPDGRYTRIVNYRWAHENLPRACWSCAHWDGACCARWSAVPPADVQLTGCAEWSGEELCPF